MFNVKLTFYHHFHVQQLACDAVQEIRIQHYWQAMEEENRQIQLAKEQKIPFNLRVLENGDTLKQLLARIGPPKRRIFIV